MAEMQGWRLTAAGVTTGDVPTHHVDYHLPPSAFPFLMLLFFVFFQPTRPLRVSVLKIGESSYSLPCELSRGNRDITTTC